MIALQETVWRKQGRSQAGGKSRGLGRLNQIRKSSGVVGGVGTWMEMRRKTEEDGVVTQGYLWGSEDSSEDRWS